VGFGDAVSSAGPYADNLHLAPDRKPHQHCIAIPLLCGGVVVMALDLRRRRSRVRLTAFPLSGNNLGQVVHTHVPLSPSSIIR